MDENSRCPVTGKTGGNPGHSGGRGTGSREWWPDQLNLDILHQHPPAPNPMDPGFDYAEEFK